MLHLDHNSNNSSKAYWRDLNQFLRPAVTVKVQGLRSYLLHYALVRCTSPDDGVASGPGPASSALRSTLLASLAVLVKRSWLDLEGRVPNPAADAAFFQVDRDSISFFGWLHCLH